MVKLPQLIFLAAFALVFPGVAMGQFGAQLTGVGPINRSMGGAATAAPLDTLGAIQWNPATISALPNSTDFGLEILMPQANLTSTVKPGALGPGFPPVQLQGSTPSDSGAFPLPNFGIVYTPEDSRFTYGIGILSVAGFGTNFAGSPNNPLLSPPPPNGLGVGPVSSQYQLLQLVPTVSYQATEKLSVAFSPIVDLANLSLDPGPLVAPDSAGGRFPTYPSLNNGMFRWGGGFQVGAYFVTERHWQFGTSFKSTQWFESFQYNAKDQNGAPRTANIQLDAPMIVSIGTAYTGIERLLLALDLRYLDYGHTKSLSTVGFDKTGAIKGLGWDSIVALSTGAQYMLTDAASLRVGYSYNSNPISNDNTFYNIASPLILQHGLSFGGSYSVTENLKISLAYAHFFYNSINGPILGPTGPLPGSDVKLGVSADSLVAGVTVNY